MTMWLSLMSAQRTRTAPARTSISIWRSEPQLVALRTIQHASVRTPTSAAESVHSAKIVERQPESRRA